MHVVTLRLALNTVRDESRRKEAELGELPTHLLMGDSELELVRAAYLPAFKDAIQRALGELAPRDRNLLRYTLIDHVSLEDLGKIHGVHRATVARWLASTREQLSERVQTELRDTLRIDPDELASLLGQIRSRLDLSLSRILTAPET
jgi:RNA polymerase sigma-70 factor (ECF subfamily)